MKVEVVGDLVEPRSSAHATERAQAIWSTFLVTAAATLELQSTCHLPHRFLFIHGDEVLRKHSSVYVAYKSLVPQQGRLVFRLVPF